MRACMHVRLLRAHPPTPQPAKGTQTTAALSLQGHHISKQKSCWTCEDAGSWIWLCILLKQDTSSLMQLQRSARKAPAPQLPPPDAPLMIEPPPAPEPLQDTAAAGPEAAPQDDDAQETARKVTPQPEGGEAAAAEPGQAPIRLVLRIGHLTPPQPQVCWLTGAT